MLEIAGEQWELFKKPARPPSAEGVTVTSVSQGKPVNRTPRGKSRATTHRHTTQEDSRGTEAWSPDSFLLPGWPMEAWAILLSSPLPTIYRYRWPHLWPNWPAQFKLYILHIVTVFVWCVSVLLFFLSSLCSISPSLLSLPISRRVPRMSLVLLKVCFY